MKQIAFIVILVSLCMVCINATTTVRGRDGAVRYRTVEDHNTRTVKDASGIVRYRVRIDNAGRETWYTPNGRIVMRSWSSNKNSMDSIRIK